MNQTTEDLLVELTDSRRNRFYSKYRGVVSDNADPDSLGRVRARVPSVLGDSLESTWALPCAPYSGDNEGDLKIPPVGARVWIEFEGGDVSRPIWSGCWWGEGQLPKNEKDNEASPDLKVLRSASGMIISLDDSANSLTLSDSNGNNFLTIEAQAGKIKIKGNTKVVVEAPAIELVENATHPVVFGDSLLQYLNQLVAMFNAHMHPGETFLGIPITPAPPQPIFPPAMSTLLSMKVKSG